MSFRFAVLAALWVGCASDEDNVRAQIDAAGLTDLHLTAPAEGSDMWTFTAKKGDLTCSGDARIDLDGAIKVRDRCRPPPGPLEQALPAGASPNLTAAAEGCDKGEAGPCVTLGESYVNGSGVPADAVKGLALIDARCEAGLAVACIRAGTIRYEGTKAERDLPRALADFDAGCKAGDGSGCALLAQMYLAGEGIAKDVRAAQTAYDRTCVELNDVAMCAKVGLLYDQGAGGLPKNEARAYALWNHGCAQGAQQCCGYAGLYLYQGSGVAANKAGGTKMLKGACDAGDAWSCDALTKLP